MPCVQVGVTCRQLWFGIVCLALSLDVSGRGDERHKADDQWIATKGVWSEQGVRTAFVTKTPAAYFAPTSATQTSWPALNWTIGTLCEVDLRDKGKVLWRQRRGDPRFLLTVSDGKTTFPRLEPWIESEDMSMTMVPMERVCAAFGSDSGLPPGDNGAKSGKLEYCHVTVAVNDYPKLAQDIKNTALFKSRMRHRATRNVHGDEDRAGDDVNRHDGHAHNEHDDHVGNGGDGDAGFDEARTTLVISSRGAIEHAHSETFDQYLINIGPGILVVDIVHRKHERRVSQFPYLSVGHRQSTERGGIAGHFQPTRIKLTSGESAVVPAYQTHEVKCTNDHCLVLKVKTPSRRSLLFDRVLRHGLPKPMNVKTLSVRDLLAAIRALVLQIIQSGLGFEKIQNINFLNPIVWNGRFSWAKDQYSQIDDKIRQQIVGALCPNTAAEPWQTRVERMTAQLRPSKEFLATWAELYRASALSSADTTRKAYSGPSAGNQEDARKECDVEVTQNKDDRHVSGQEAQDGQVDGGDNGEWEMSHVSEYMGLHIADYMEYAIAEVCAMHPQKCHIRMLPYIIDKCIMGNMWLRGRGRTKTKQ